MRYQLLLWDFDGTLADTLAIALDVYNQLAAEKKFRTVEDPSVVRDMGMREFLTSHGVPLHRVPFFFSSFLKKLKFHQQDVQLNPGIQRTLQAVSTLGIQQGVVSSNTTENILQCLRQNEVEQHFACVIGTSTIFGKEKRIRTAIKELNTPRSDVLYVGDEIRDIKAAASAGCDVAAVRWGLNSENALVAHRPTHFVSHPSQLLDVLKGASISSAPS